MSAAVLFVEDDLSLAALSKAGETQFWRPPVAERPKDANREDDALDAVTQNIARVKDLAAWARKNAGRAGGLTLCVGVKRSVCERVKAPSANPTVIAAAITQRDSDNRAAAQFASLSVEAVATPASLVDPLATDDATKGPLGRLWQRSSPGSASNQQGVFTVLEAPTAQIRMVMDALDRRGASIDEVFSQWHALLRAFAPASEATATSAAAKESRTAQANSVTTAAPRASKPSVSVEGPIEAVVGMGDNGELLWAWGSAGILIAGGRVAGRRIASSRAPETNGNPAAVTDRTDGSIFSRLTLDWLAWAAQLESAPARIVLAGPASITTGIADRLADGWPDIKIETHDAPDALVATLDRLTRGAPDGESDESAHSPTPTTSARLETLSTRASRRHRAAALWMTAALSLVGAAGVIAGARALRDTASLRTEAATLNGQVRDQAIAAIAPDPLAAGDPIRVLLSKLEEVRQAFSPPMPPPAPRPIREEVKHLADAIKSVQGAKLFRVNLDNRTGLATINIPNIEAGERLQLAIRKMGGRVRWTGQFIGAAPNLTLRLSAIWEPLQ